MKELPIFFEPIIDLMAGYIESGEDHWTLQTTGGHYINGPYVQALLEHDNMILIESVSNKFLNPELTEAGHTALLFMGWRFFPGDHYPNYAQMLDLGKNEPKEIAIKMAQALHFAYGVDENYSFEIAPQNEVSRRVIKKGLQ